MNQEFDPSAASGESAMRGARSLELNEVSLNGDGDVKEVEPGKFIRQGGYFRKRVLIGNPKDQKPEEINLGKEVTVVFLKIRRKLAERGKDGKILRSTNEHNSLKESVMLYEGERKESGVAEDLRKKYEGLRTVQVIYALLLDGTAQPELVRLIVKGASLGSEAKDKSVPTFYDYIQSFKGDDHFYQYKTMLTPILEEGKKTYYAINFKRGEKVNEKGYALVLEKMKEVHENCTAVDTQRAMRIVKETTVDTDPDIVPEEEVADAPADRPDYPADDISPEDIPF